MEEDCEMPANTLVTKPQAVNLTNTKRPHQTDSDELSQMSEEKQE